MSTVRDTVRLKIAELRGAPFSSADLPAHSNIRTVLKRLEEGGEIALVGYEATKGKPRKVYKEVKLKMERANAAKQPPQPKTPWELVWPEFFSAPKLSGSSRMIVNLTNTEE